MPRNKILDLNDHLFEQLERLNDESLEGEELEKEIARSRAITDVAARIIDNASLGLQAAKLQAEYGRGEVKIPTMLLGNNDA